MAGAQGRSGWLEAPTAGPCGMGAHPWVCQWVWVQDEALVVTEVQHRTGHLPQGLKHRCPWHVPPTSRNSREEKKGFLLIAVEGRLLVHCDFWEHRVQAWIRGSNYAEKNTQL